MTAGFCWRFGILHLGNYHLDFTMIKNEIRLIRREVLNIKSKA